MGRKLDGNIETKIPRIGAAASLPVFLLAVGMYRRLLPYSESPTYEQLFLGFRDVLGGDRCSLVMLGLLLLPALASRASLRSHYWTATARANRLRN